MRAFTVVRRSLIASLVVFVGSWFIPAQAWEGYDYDRGTYIEIERGTKVRKGRDVDYYDYSSGEYRSGTVESIRQRGSRVELEVYEYDSGEYRQFEMSRRRR